VSKVETRFPFAQALSWATEALGVVTKHSPRVAIAGSLRRGCSDIGDIDLVLLEDVGTNPWQHNAIANALAELGYVQTKDGEKIASFTRAGKASLDLYYATPATWGITMVVRTGSAAHNIKLVKVGERQLPARKLSVARGVIDTAGNVIAGADERGVFDALGQKYVEPEDREAPAFQHLVGGE
jgi:DNA polymerase/3'-5' exonuclease PolX